LPHPDKRVVYLELKLQYPIEIYFDAAAIGQALILPQASEDDLFICDIQEKMMFFCMYPSRNAKAASAKPQRLIGRCTALLVCPEMHQICRCPLSYTNSNTPGAWVAGASHSIAANLSFSNVLNTRGFFYPKSSIFKPAAATLCRPYLQYTSQ